ncbi:hypothetical protein FN846DRAFT_544047 [Sphaerosporella brunnea]|uniref:C2H2-type domain-containing protein n=1 Tax=Sphaerosporella brunnea TaxID=1250544 RepID=A0A5J5F2K2_9PEZI|nr:hypothetical protein FN846DRAFT_544047 [Sphaerosporella brunnea]
MPPSSYRISCPLLHSPTRTACFPSRPAIHTYKHRSFCFLQTMDRQQSTEQPSEGFWTTPPLFSQQPAAEDQDQYTLPSAQMDTIRQHRDGHQDHDERYSPWFPSQTVTQVPWLAEPSDSLFPPAGPLPTVIRPRTSSDLSEQDEYGRFVCKYPECEAKPEDRIFTRKSDWRRHFDKHTRPYRCSYPSCKDLAGFGWVGGLNRHLEELHNSKAQHKCPYIDCKRHINGFSRSANLKNHLRKVHNVDCGDGGGGPSTAASENSGEENDMPDSPPAPQRVVKRPRQTLRSRENIMKEIQELEREVVLREEELREARQRKVDVLVQLERLRAELEDVCLQEQALHDAWP